jgi:hypothetical protein
MDPRTVSPRQVRRHLARLLTGTLLGAALLAACQQDPSEAAKSGSGTSLTSSNLVKCTAQLAGSPPATPGNPPVEAAPPGEPATPASTARLYMADGQLISHGLTVYVTADLHASSDVQLKLFRSHAITSPGAGEDQPLVPALVAAGQEWSETFQGRPIHPRGTMLIFDTSRMSLETRAMTRVRPLLTWRDGGVERAQRSQRR